MEVEKGGAQDRCFILVRTMCTCAERERERENAVGRRRLCVRAASVGASDDIRVHYYIYLLLLPEIICAGVWKDGCGLCRVHGKVPGYANGGEASYLDT